MTSIRHTPQRYTSADHLLDAARASILDVGWSRTTLTDIARRAGVSRMTLYRRWPDTGTLLADLMTREWTLALGEVLADDENSVDVVTMVVRTLQIVRDNELTQRILQLDPEMLLPYLLERPGRSQELISDVLAGQIKAAQRVGSVRKGNATTMARSILLAGHGFLLSAHTMGDVTTFDRELRTMVKGYLQP
jgi:AcrR family transcriptional regulator